MEQNVDQSLSDLFNQYKKSHETTRRMSREDMMKQYFVPRNASEVFRILPKHDGQGYFEEAYFHYLKVGNAWRKLYCPKHNDKEDCHLCNLADKLYKMQDKTVFEKVKGKKDDELSPELKKAKDKNSKIYEEYKKWAVIKFYISKGLDKGSLKDGVKFWRFKHNKLQKGVLDKLIPVISHFNKTTGKNFSDPQLGCDFSLTVSENRMANGKAYKEVSSILPDGPKILTDDQVLYKAALDDRKTWRDVYKKSNPPLITYDEYLKLITLGKAPYFDNKDPNNKRWIYPDNPELEAKANTKNNSQNNDDINDQDFDEDTLSSGSASDYLQSSPAPAVPTSAPINVSTSKPSEEVFDPLKSAIDDLPF